ncbi:MAG: InlB B-repeat-containing protein [Oscillospiraceae bacterium]|nr:InlB B-repeat-containing protein [Oscillospiraceae bacterium]
MKKRLIAILLCLATVVSFAVPGTLAFGETVGAQLFLDGAAVSEASFPVNEKLTLAVGSGTDGACQWQLYIPAIDAWVNIQGQTGVTCNVSYAMLSNALDGNGQAKIRASVDTGSGLVYSNEAVITPEEAGQSKDAPVMLKAVRPSASQNSTANTTPSVSDEELEPLYAEAERAEAARDQASAKAGAANAELQQAQARYNAALAAVNANPAADLEKAQADFDVAAAALSSAQAEYDAANDALNAAQAENDVEAATAAVANVQAATTKLTSANSSYNVASAALSSAQSAANAAGDSSTAQAELDAATAALDEAKSKAEAANAELEAAEAAYAKADAALNAALDGSSTGNTDSSTYETSTEGDKVYYYIKYYYYENGEEGEKVADDYVAELAKGSNFSDTVTIPVKQGYVPYLSTDLDTPYEKDTYDINVSNVTAEETVIKFYYRPAIVNYTVIHYQQNVDNDNYRLFETETRSGETNSEVPEVAKGYEGFTPLKYERPNIAADGSTVVEIYYDRIYVLMNFDLDGGYGTEPIYARYGAPIDNVATPTKAGYSFEGWSLTKENQSKVEVYTTMPAKNITYYAMWGEPNAVNYTVVYWKENPNDSDYSYWGSETKSETTGRKVSGSDSIPESIHNGEDEYFTYNAEKTQKDVEIKGDGSSIVNVYYKRNVYTLTFAITGLTCGQEEHYHDRSCEIVCGKEEHTHNWRCDYGNDCNREEHTHSADCFSCGKTEHWHDYPGCYGNVAVKTISAKYQQDIRSNFPIIGTDGNNYEGYWWLVPDEGEPFFEPDTYVVSIDTMPGKNITFTGSYKGKDAKIYYYIETLNGQNGATTYNNKNFDLYKTVITVNSGNLTYLEEFHDITGFTQWESDPVFNSEGRAKVKAENFLYYTRNSYKLKYYNYNGYLTANEATLQYQAPLTNYNVANPSYPSGLEPNAYEFEGWYTTENCVEGTKVDFTKMTMPASDVTLYAHWVPVQHTVKFYFDKSGMEQNPETPDATVEVDHGEKAETPDTPVREGYDFVGWFYMEDGKEKAYSFENMPVRKDLTVYGKWLSSNIVEYSVYFKTIIDGEEVEIAKAIESSAQEGITKTFDAKGAEELYPDYQETYFPDVKSHSMTLTKGAENSFTFWYTKKEAVPYTVKYINEETGAALIEDKVVTDNLKAVVTENFVPITGYMPDAYQKRLVVSGAEGAVNEIIFYYHADAEHAPVHVVHYIQNAENDEYSVYEEITDLETKIGQTYTTDILTIPGFEYDRATMNNTGNENGEVPATVADGKVSGTVDKAGLELKIYYNRNVYPYQVRYLEQGSGKELAPPKKSEEGKPVEGRYGQIITENAIEIDGYTLVSNKEQHLTIKIEELEENEEPTINVINFYYKENEVTINYVAVGPDGSVLGANNNIGNVSPEAETIKVLSGTAEGSTATPSSNAYRFDGWYIDPECETEVSEANGSLSEDGNTFVPGKDSSTELYETATYYAKFEYNLTTLTITKTVVGAGPGKGPDGFIFDVYEVNSDESLTKVATVAISGSGSTTIHGLTVGKTYKVVENRAWSCWYDASYGDNNPITLAASGNEVNVSNTYSYENILHGGHSVTNRNPVVNN